MSSTGRAYHSPRRDAQAQATRDGILDAARALFAERGVAATRITDVADAAKVSRATVVATFGTKRGILESLIARTARGDDVEVRLTQQAEWRDMLAAADAAELLRRHANIAARVHQRVAELIEIITREAGVDPELEEVRRAGAERRLRDTRQVIDALAERSWLRAELSRPQATETLWALNHPVLFRTLTVERGWSPGRWARWLADVSFHTIAAGG
jgi:AcrR family transcriptional regulator